MAQNVVVWSNRSGKGRAKITDFSYKNIIGRGGRMLRHFVGNIYLLDKPPVEAATDLNLSVPDELLGGTNEEDFEADLTADQIAKIIAYKEELVDLVGDEGYQFIRDSNAIQTTHSGVIKDIVTDLHTKPGSWNGLKYLNSEHPEDWDRLLYKILRLQPGVWGASYTSVVEFIKILSGNWRYSIPELLSQLDSLNIGLDDFSNLSEPSLFVYRGCWETSVPCKKRSLALQLLTSASSLPKCLRPSSRRSCISWKSMGYPDLFPRKYNAQGCSTLKTKSWIFMRPSAIC
ncbi:hypothetical protein AL065_03490 [Pseudomonas amygdali pv. ulmi]|uniref:hypothetical protein n=1 Tax=Pseudomonas amygdali TaxID=47877 RepID=UPI000709D5C7|nr:hypothetical protein [Pseudomonas amygdali]KWS21947.1 hypothetical protein AL065_03490 [Pseudomonas amygdali pv. ulmi]